MTIKWGIIGATFHCVWMGYSLENSQTLIGNEIERTVAWKSGEDVSKLAGKPVRLLFVMKDADLYALRFK